MIDVDNLFIQAGPFQLRHVTFHVPTGAYAVLMGRTGSGKTTILESVIGLRAVAGGSICLDGRDVTHHKPAVRGVGYVPQDGALFSTMTVSEQIGLGLVIRGYDRVAVRQRVDELGEHLGISHLLARKPRGLSGGERQRVALGRALAFRPRVLCLDEPLSALDDDTRGEMIALLKQVRRETGVTVLHVTHNRSEAEQLGDVWLQVTQGRVQQSPPHPPVATGDSPSDLPTDDEDVCPADGPVIS